MMVLYMQKALVMQAGEGPSQRWSRCGRKTWKRQGVKKPISEGAGIT